MNLRDFPSIRISLQSSRSSKKIIEKSIPSWLYQAIDVSTTDLAIRFRPSTRRGFEKWLRRETLGMRFAQKDIISNNLSQYNSSGKKGNKKETYCDILENLEIIDPY